MNNFKSGSGNLDFGGSDREQADEFADDSESSDGTTVSTDDNSDSPAADYPYFLRRTNVGDERDTRLEIHVRDEIADHEATFRRELAEELDTDEISKTDAREFALLAAFHHPERVAELMREDGFDALE